MEKFLKKLPKLTGVMVKDITIDCPFDVYVSCFAETPGTVVLLSGGEADCARYNIAAIEPWLEIQAKNMTTTFSAHGESASFKINPLDALEYTLQWFQCDSLPDYAPVMTGLFGYLAYDLKDAIENLPRTTMDEHHLPDLFFMLPTAVIIQDRQTGDAHIFIAERSGISSEDICSRILKTLQKNPEASTPFSGGQSGFTSNFDQQSYMHTIDTIIDYIKTGDIYQANMSQKFTTDFSGSAYGLFQYLFQKNPAPFFAYVNAGDHFIVSTSPERFVLQNKRFVESRPIKGTRPRGDTDAKDAELRKDLVNSPKDDAELSMIVDLIRNDISRVCCGGSVRVAHHKKVEAYKNVYHLVSLVEGELTPESDAVDLIRATFPGGSITGCPKIRSMEIIDELETVNRHVYTGSIGYISFHDTMDLSIAIRTATIADKTLGFSVGGAIVYDSDPEDEFHETLHKGKTLLDSFADKVPHPQTQRMIWQNGRFLPESKATVSVSSPGFQYGYGFFETIQVKDGRIAFLDDHISRFEHAWQTLFNGPVPLLSWDRIIRWLVQKNGLTETTAAVKIMASADTTDRKTGTVIISATPYVNRLKALHTHGIKLITFKDPRCTPLADHKTLNYMYYIIAGNYAKTCGGDEALILNPDQSISETNTANLICIKGKTAFFPVSDHVLPGVMQKKALALLKGAGFSVTGRMINHSEIDDFDAILLTNSLMECVPVISVDGKKMRTDAADVCTMINRNLLTLYP